MISILWIYLIFLFLIAFLFYLIILSEDANFSLKNPIKGVVRLLLIYQYPRNRGSMELIPFYPKENGPIFAKIWTPFCRLFELRNRGENGAHLESSKILAPNECASEQ